MQKDIKEEYPIVHTAKAQNKLETNIPDYKIVALRTHYLPRRPHPARAYA